LTSVRRTRWSTSPAAGSSSLSRRSSPPTSIPARFTPSAPRLSG